MATELQVWELFAVRGPVERHHHGQGQGDGRTPCADAFVEMTQATEAQGAISAQDGTMLNGVR